VRNLQENLLFFTLILGLVFGDYVVFYRDYYYLLCHVKAAHKDNEHK